MRDPPSGRVPEQGPDWFLVATEVCGGGTPDLGYFLDVSVFIGIFGVGLTFCFRLDTCFRLVSPVDTISLMLLR